MRIGDNPAKEKPDLAPYPRYRVIVPVYIPYYEGYFIHAIEVLRLCLHSIVETSRGIANITVISNGSHEAVVEELQAWLLRGEIDQIVINRENRGKVDAVVACARGTYEEFITITDSDVLFRNGWIEDADSIFRSFPKCGFLALAPNPRHSWNATATTIIDNALLFRLKFKKVVSEQDLDAFEESIQAPGLFNESHRTRQLVIIKNGIIACIGGGHFAFVIRRNVLSAMPTIPTLMTLDGHTEKRWIDVPPDVYGSWKLASPRALVNHIGNCPQQWMYTELAQLHRGNTTTQALETPGMRRSMLAWIPYRIRRMVAWLIKQMISI